MINKDSIVTAYDEHLTLVEWLQKVENALDNAVLTNLGIAKLSDQGNIATYRVTATFADNTTIVSDNFTLPSTNIVTAFNNLTTLVNGFDDRITDNTNDVASIIDIIDIGNDKIKASTLQNSINGSDDVIVDVDATNDKLEIHLSAELQAKLARVLLKPSSAPSTRKVVTIDTNGAQDNVDGTELTTLMTNIVDSHGNPRFIEGNGAIASIEGLTSKYNKWSLSGSHLMTVLCGTLDANTTIDSGRALSWFTLPSWIYDKIITTRGDGLVEYKEIPCFKQTGFDQIKLPIRFEKNSNNHISFVKTGSFTANETLYFCIQFDLLIDSE